MKDLRVITLIDYFKQIPISWPGGCRLPTWSILGILGSKRNGPILLPSIGHFSKTDSDIFIQSGVFSLGMGIAQKVVGWQYKNWKEIRSLGVTRYFLVYCKRLSDLEIFLNIYHLALVTMGTLFSVVHPYESCFLSLHVILVKYDSTFSSVIVFFLRMINTNFTPCMVLGKSDNSLTE